MKLSWSCPRTLPIFGANAFPDGIHAGKQLLYERVADQANVSPVLCFRCREVAAKFDDARVNVRHIRRLPVETHVSHLFVTVSCVHAAAGGGTHLCARRASLGYRAHVVHLNLFVLQRFDDDVEVGHREGCSRDLKDVCAEVGDLLLNIEVRALHDGHHRDQGGHAHRQPQHRKRRAQLMRAQGAQALR